MTYMINIDWIISVLAFISIYLIAVIALNLQYGYTGIPNFGLALSIAGGAFVAGALTGRIAMWYYGVDSNLDFISDNSIITSIINQRLAHDPLGGITIFLLIIAISMLINAFLGFIAAYPAIRLREDYLIMVLIAMAEGIRIIGINYRPLVGGTLWVHVPDLFAWLGDLRRTIYVIIMFISSMLIFVLVQLLVTSPFGRLIRAIRENEILADSLGKNIVKVKMIVMVLGSALASIAGVLFALYTEVVMATSYNRIDWTFWPWLMLMIGGMGNNVGAFVGTIAVILARRLIIFYKHEIEHFIPFSVVWLEHILLGITLILFMAFRPQGLMPEKPTKVRGLADYSKIYTKVKEKLMQNNE